MENGHSTEVDVYAEVESFLQALVTTQTNMVKTDHTTKFLKNGMAIFIPKA